MSQKIGEKMNALQALIVNLFHRIYYQKEGWAKNEFLGFPINQNPFDLHLYQEIIYQVRPDFIV